MIVGFERAQIGDTDARGFEHLLERELFFLADLFELLTYGLHYMKQNITSAHPDGGILLVM